MLSVSANSLLHPGVTSGLRRGGRRSARGVPSEMELIIANMPSAICSRSGARLALLLIVGSCCALQARGQSSPSASPATLTYTRLLQGSVPEYTLVRIQSDGTGAYEGRKADEAPSPRPLKLSPHTTQKLFALASELHDFRSIDLESHRAVANLGLKTFTYEGGGEKNSCEFNYTLNRRAQELTDLFERIATVERHLISLEYAMKYDHLSLPQELLQIQIDLDNKAITDPQLLVDTLEQIAHNSRYLHVAQVRAQNILQRVQDQ